MSSLAAQGTHLLSVAAVFTVCFSLCLSEDKDGEDALTAIHGSRRNDSERYCRSPALPPFGCALLQRDTKFARTDFEADDDSQPNASEESRAQRYHLFTKYNASLKSGRVNRTLLQSSVNVAVNAHASMNMSTLSNQSVVTGTPELANQISSGRPTFINKTDMVSLRGLSSGKDIWNASAVWANFTLSHPHGVVSKLSQQKVGWANVPFISLSTLCALTLVAYPLGLLVALLLLSAFVGSCLQQSGDMDIGDSVGSSIFQVPSLTSTSQCLYDIWKGFCCAIPCIFVVSTPMALMYCSYPFPREVFVTLVLISSVFVWTNTAYLVAFAPMTFRKIWRHMGNSAEDVLSSCNDEDWGNVVHWVILPNYNEDLNILEMTMASVARSSIARTQICVLLAMEEREPASETKAAALKTRFANQFCEVDISFHPAALINDPPGKASNVAWAFKCLQKRLASAKELEDKVILTIADADSEFHELYFENLTSQYLGTDAGQCSKENVGLRQRDLTLWQAPVLHMKNYHRQPGPLVVGTLFTAMTEAATLADPNAIRFPYSTYSLSMRLASHVGGWDAEWIAEDWHMGIKCFLVTLGWSQVQPIMLPTMNYTPEDTTWASTLTARWAQAKRHALGYSDLAYIFMMLPLVFQHVSGGASFTEKLERMFRCAKLLTTVPAYLIRLVNTHVIVSTLAFCTLGQISLQKLMKLGLDEQRHVQLLLEQTILTWGTLGIATTLLMAVLLNHFLDLYQLFNSRLEPATSKRWQTVFASRFLHWAYLFACFSFSGPFYFLLLGAAVWIAAGKCLLLRKGCGQLHFDYEVATKPSPLSKV